MPTPNQESKLDLTALMENAGAKDGILDFPSFIRFALYEPERGYYSKQRKRVGRQSQTDFYTAQSLGPVFGKLVVQSCATLLGKSNLSEYVFVEIGAEPEECLLEGAIHPFSSSSTIRLGDKIQIPEKSVVFANEWLDSQPFRRFRFDKDKGWIERGLKLGKDSQLKEVDLPETGIPLPQCLQESDSQSCHNYILDLPGGANQALEALCNQPWSGLFLTFDYGLSLRQFIEERPKGIARAYHKHRITDKLTANVGEQDLTCHVCWDMLSEILEKSGFENLFLERQESFFLKHANSVVEQIVKAKPGTFDADRQTLLELLHPGNMGSKFQAFGGVRNQST